VCNWYRTESAEERSSYHHHRAEELNMCRDEV
jgi:hypothetical protein